MEDIAPPLAMLLAVRWSLERGDSIRLAVTNYIEEMPVGPWKRDVLTWWSLCNMQSSTTNFYQEQSSLHRRTLLQVLELGLRGASIYQQICQLEEETYQACEDEIDQRASLLSIQALLPLLFLQFPAFFLLLLGPLLKTILEAAT
jgi:hypothetical protein